MTSQERTSRGVAALAPGHPPHLGLRLGQFGFKLIRFLGHIYARPSFYSWRLVLLCFKCSNVFLPSWKPFRIRHIKFPTLEKNFKTLFIWKLLSQIYFFTGSENGFSGEPLKKQYCWMLLDVGGCWWMLMDVGGCWWRLLDVGGCCWKTIKWLHVPEFPLSPWTRGGTLHSVKGRICPTCRNPVFYGCQRCEAAH